MVFMTFSCFALFHCKAQPFIDASILLIHFRVKSREKIFVLYFRHRIYSRKKREALVISQGSPLVHSRKFYVTED